MSCILKSELKDTAWENVYQEGDVFKFQMPGWCSGDYEFTVVNGMLEDAPSKVFDGCIDFVLYRDGKIVENENSYEHFIRNTNIPRLDEITNDEIFYYFDDNDNIVIAEMNAYNQMSVLDTIKGKRYGK